MAFKLSVVLTTFNRSRLLQKALISLAGQTLGNEEFEVIVVDDGSSDNTFEVVKLMNTILQIKYSYQLNSGLASAKNHGLFLASGDIVLFLDDDDISDSSLVEQHILAHSVNPSRNIAILGKTSLSPSLKSDPLMYYVTQTDPMLFCYEGMHDRGVHDYEYFWGGRTSCKRELLLKEGVFNPVFRFGYEDIELGYRLNQKAGLQVVYWEQAQNSMVRQIDLPSFIRRCVLQGQSAWKFLELHGMDKSIELYFDCNKLFKDLEILDPAYEASLLSATKLEALIREAATMGYDVPVAWQKALDLAYYRAFRAAMSRGVNIAKHGSQQSSVTVTT